MANKVLLVAAMHNEPYYPYVKDNLLYCYQLKITKLVAVFNRNANGSVLCNPNVGYLMPVAISFNKLYNYLAQRRTMKQCQYMLLCATNIMAKHCITIANNVVLLYMSNNKELLLIIAIGGT